MRNLRGDEEFDEPLKKRASLKIDCVSLQKKVSQLIKAECNQIVFLFALSVQLVFSESLAILIAVVFKPRKKSFYLLSSVLILLIQKEESSESNPRQKKVLGTSSRKNSLPQKPAPNKAGFIPQAQWFPSQEKSTNRIHN